MILEYPSRIQWDSVETEYDMIPNPTQILPNPAES